MRHPAQWGIRCVLAVLAVTVVTAVSAPASATATYYRQWSCGRIAPNTWCWFASDATHTWDRNAASHTYPINLCEKMIRPNYSPEYQYSRRCAYADHLNGYSDDNGRASYPNLSTSMWVLVANGDNPFYATVDGAADAG
jgi:hypothetical protein